MQPLDAPYLRTVEEWTLINESEYDHPFHIHVNGFQVMSVEGKRVRANGHQDVVNIPKQHVENGKLVNGRVVIRQLRDLHGLVRLPLPHPRARGRGDDGGDPGAKPRRSQEAGARIRRRTRARRALDRHGGSKRSTTMSSRRCTTSTWSWSSSGANGMPSWAQTSPNRGGSRTPRVRSSGRRRRRPARRSWPSGPR